jgi:hypothetical protein
MADSLDFVAAERLLFGRKIAFSGNFPVEQGNFEAHSLQKAVGSM